MIAALLLLAALAVAALPSGLETRNPKPETREALDAALDQAAALREGGHIDEAIDLLRPLRGRDLSPDDRLRVAYELVVTHVRAGQQSPGQLAQAIDVARSVLAAAPATGQPGDVELRIRLLEIVAHLRQADARNTDHHLTLGLGLARDLAERGPRAKAGVLGLVAAWHAQQPDLAKDDPLVQFAAVDRLLRQEKYAEAVKAGETFVGLPATPERKGLLPDAWLTLGAAHFRRKAFRQAAECFSRVAADYPASPVAPEAAYNATVAWENLLGQRSEVRGQREDLEGYIGSLRRYIAGFPTHAKAGEARWRLAQALFRDAEDFPAAAEAFAQIPPADPDYWMALLMIAECEEKVLSAQCAVRSDTDKATVTSHSALRTAHLVDALWRFSTHVLAKRDWPDDATRLRARGEAAQARLRIADCGLRIADGEAGPNQSSRIPPDMALAGFETDFPEQKDLFPRAAALRLEAAILADRMKDAEQQLARILRTWPQDPATLRALRDAEGRLQSAIRNPLERGPLGGPQSAMHTRLARVYGLFVTWLGAQSGDLATYVGDYTAKQGLELHRAGMFAEAQPVLERAHSALPTPHCALLSALADCCERAGKYDDALGHYRDLADGLTEGSEAWFQAKYDVSRMHLKRGQPKDGLRLIRVLREGWPDLGGPDLKARFLALERELQAAER